MPRDESMDQTAESSAFHQANTPRFGCLATALVFGATLVTLAAWDHGDADLAGAVVVLVIAGLLIRFEDVGRATRRIDRVIGAIVVATGVAWSAIDQGDNLFPRGLVLVGVTIALSGLPRRRRPR